jgi:hypothetical protein
LLLHGFVSFSDYGAHRGKENADAVETDMGLQSAAAIKFCFRKLVRADVRMRKCADSALLAETPVKRRRYGCCFTSAFGRFCCRNRQTVRLPCGHHGYAGDPTGNRFVEFLLYGEVPARGGHPSEDLVGAPAGRLAHFMPSDIPSILPLPRIASHWGGAT